MPTMQIQQLCGFNSAAIQYMQHYMSIDLQHFHPKLQFFVPHGSSTMGGHRIMTEGIQIQEKDKKNQCKNVMVHYLCNTELQVYRTQRLINCSKLNKIWLLI
jgi:hypothetical protein